MSTTVSDALCAEVVKFSGGSGVGHLEALELLSKECAGKVGYFTHLASECDVLLMCLQAHSSVGGLDDGDLQSVQANWGKLSQAFVIDEEQDSEYFCWLLYSELPLLWAPLYPGFPLL